MANSTEKKEIVAGDATIVIVEKTKEEKKKFSLLNFILGVLVFVLIIYALGHVRSIAEERSANAAAADRHHAGMTVPSECPPTLSEGAAGQNVRTLQQAVTDAGHETAVDGVFGPNTVSAVASLQRDHGLVGNGIVDQDTWHALGSC